MIVASMNVVEWNGNQYKIVNGTAYSLETSDIVVGHLERLRKSKERARFFYGNPATGRDYLAENDTIGYVDRSTGQLKIPLLIKKKDAIGGIPILDPHIVKITVNKRLVYQHPNYHLPSLRSEVCKDQHRISKGFAIDVFADDKLIASFKSQEKADRWIKFIYGERNSY